MIWDLHPETKNILEMVRISLTIVGGIGAVGWRGPAACFRWDGTRMRARC